MYKSENAHKSKHIITHTIIPPFPKQTKVQVNRSERCKVLTFSSMDVFPYLGLQKFTRTMACHKYGCQIGQHSAFLNWPAKLWLLTPILPQHSLLRKAQILWQKRSTWKTSSPTPHPKRNPSPVAFSQIETAEKRGKHVIHLQANGETRKM